MWESTYHALWHGWMIFIVQCRTPDSRRLCICEGMGRVGGYKSVVSVVEAYDRHIYNSLKLVGLAACVLQIRACESLLMFRNEGRLYMRLRTPPY